MVDADLARHERSLRDAALTGAAPAWRALFESAYDPVHAYLRWRLGGRGDAVDDLAQETWLVAVRRLTDFDPGAGPFAGWVCGIAANVVRRHVRTRLRHAARVRPLGDADPPAVAVADNDTADRIAAALAALPERYERVLRAKYLDQMSVDAIAVAWGESPKAVESLLTRARQAFRDVYEHDTPP